MPTVFLAAIVAAPADAALRHIYADFLDDHGQSAEALAWRETADRVPSIVIDDDYGDRWRWWRSGWEPDCVVPAEVLSRCLFLHLPADADGDCGASRPFNFRWYATVLDAIRAIVEAAMRLKEDGQ